MFNLPNLFQTISQAKDEQELRSHILAEIGEYFAAKRWGLFFFDRLPTNQKNFPSKFQTAVSTEHNPVLRYLVERHTPVHEELVVTPKVWQLICPRRDHWHVMAGPLVNNGKLLGAIGFTRDRGMPPFDSQNLLDLSALCLHISTWLVKLHFSKVNQENLQQLNRNAEGFCEEAHITPRELQIAQLVAQGKTNAQIRTELWITENSVKQALKRMFRKLQVSSRAEMLARLSPNTKLFLA
jgi:DNA-binding CsgD family transcriptional regulator